MNFTDPTGYFWGAIFRAIVRAIVGAIVGGARSAIAGGISGGISSVATGGDFGQAALIGGVSAGVAKFVGEKIPFLRQTAETVGEFTAQAVLRAAVGTVVGGATSSAFGGDFAQGAQYGAIAATVGFVANDSIHPGGYLNGKFQLVLRDFYNAAANVGGALKQWVANTFAGSRYGGGVGFSARAKVLTTEIGIKSHSIQGYALTRSGIAEFTEESTKIYVKVGGAELSNKGFKYEQFNFSNLSVDLGGTIPLTYSGVPAINAEIKFNIRGALGQ